MYDEKEYLKENKFLLNKLRKMNRSQLQSKSDELNKQFEKYANLIFDKKILNKNADYEMRAASSRKHFIDECIGGNVKWENVDKLKIFIANDIKKNNLIDNSAYKINFSKYENYFFTHSCEIKAAIIELGYPAYMNDEENSDCWYIYKK